MRDLVFGVKYVVVKKKKRKLFLFKHELLTSYVFFFLHENKIIYDCLLCVYTVSEEAEMLFWLRLRVTLDDSME